MLLLSVSPPVAGEGGAGSCLLPNLVSQSINAQLPSSVCSTSVVQTQPTQPVLPPDSEHVSGAVLDVALPLLGRSHGPISVRSREWIGVPGTKAARHASLVAGRDPRRLLSANPLWRQAAVPLILVRCLTFIARYPSVVKLPCRRSAMSLRPDRLRRFQADFTPHSEPLKKLQRQSHLPVAPPPTPSRTRIQPEPAARSATAPLSQFFG